MFIVLSSFQLFFPQLSLTFHAFFKKSPLQKYFKKVFYMNICIVVPLLSWSRKGPILKKWMENFSFPWKTIVWLNFWPINLEENFKRPFVLSWNFYGVTYLIHIRYKIGICLYSTRNTYVRRYSFPLLYNRQHHFRNCDGQYGSSPVLELGQE